MKQNPELTALSEVYETLKGLGRAQQMRILNWVADKFGVPEAKGEQTVETPSTVQLQKEPAPVETAVQVEEPVIKKRRGRRSGPEAPVKARLGRPPRVEKSEAPVKKRRGRRPVTIENEFSAPAQPSEPSVFHTFETLEDVFLKAQVKTLAAKILLAAAYLQEKNHLAEITSQVINANLKKIEEGIPNINIPMNSLLSKEPPLLEQTGAIGNSPKAKRKFKVTEEGLRIAGNYIIE